MSHLSLLIWISSVVLNAILPAPTPILSSNFSFLDSAGSLLLPFTTYIMALIPCIIVSCMLIGLLH